jgi:predicted alternative tryptophan synthase beta-subunit
MLRPEKPERNHAIRVAVREALAARRSARRKSAAAPTN